MLSIPHETHKTDNVQKVDNLPGDNFNAYEHMLWTSVFVAATAATRCRWQGHANNSESDQVTTQ